MSWRRKSYRKNRDEDDDFESRSRGLLPWDDFESLFDFENIDQLIERMFRVAQSTGGDESSSITPIYYGYSIVTGPDGKPHVREFGNVKPTNRGTFERSSREPFVDTVVDEKENRLKVIAEMPGVQREDIKLEVMEDSLNIRAEHGERKYETTVPVQVPIDTNTASATYNNGVLEVNIRIRSKPQPKGVTVKID